MAKEVYWIGKVPAKDSFGAHIGQEFIDGRTRPGGPWAIMTPTNHDRYGHGLGVGRGQKYRLQADGRWLKVEG